MPENPQSPGGDISFEVSEAFNRVRADKVLHDHCPELSRNQIQRFFDEGLVWYDNEAIIKSRRLFAGDTISYSVSSPKKLTLEPIPIPLDILFEDEHIVIVNKAAGIVVHPGNGTVDPTLVHALLYHCRDSLSGIGGVERPGIVHRLDKNTSGAIIVAKTDAAYVKLSKMFEKRDLKKVYLTVVNGVPSQLSGTIKEPIGRHPVNRIKMSVNHRGRDAHTDWKREEVFGDFAALLNIRIYTGRTHQIRVHLAHIGHPVAGDLLYGYKSGKINTILIDRVLLHAYQLTFSHPITRQILEIEAPLPIDFLTVLGDFRERLIS